MTTMIADQVRSKTRLGVGFDSARFRPRETEAWRRAIGTRPIPARLALLPEEKKKWDRIGWSAFFQIFIVGFFIVMPIFFPERLDALKYQVIPLMMPMTEIPVAPPPPPPKIKAPEPKPKPIPVEEPKL